MKVGSVFVPIVLGAAAVLFAGCSKPPVPYTEKALFNLRDAVARVEEPVPEPGATDADTLRLYVEYSRRLYSTAGYDFDKSIVKLCGDLAKDPEYVWKLPSNGTAQLTLVSMVQLTELAAQAQVNLDQYLSRAAARALLDYEARQKAGAE